MLKRLFVLFTMHRRIMPLGNFEIENTFLLTMLMWLSLPSSISTPLILSSPISYSSTSIKPFSFFKSFSLLEVYLMVKVKGSRSLLVLSWNLLGVMSSAVL